MPRAPPHQLLRAATRREAHWQGPSHRAAGSPSGGSLAVRIRLVARQPAPSVISVTFPPTLHTARLTLNPYQQADEQDFVALFQDTRVSQYMGDGPQPEAEDRALFHRVFGVYAERRFAVWAVRRGGRLVGHAEIKYTATVDGHEIIYALAADQWGHGLGIELARAIIGYGWNTLGLDQVHATVDDANIGSSMLLQRLGFVHARNIAEDAGIVRVYTLARP
jgi:RimJ/RimL family protein N-acetyltransferase